MPTRLGAAAIALVESKSILSEASGFIGRYRYTLNPYSGCSFACEYCYARSFAPTSEKRDSWGSWVSVKENAVALIGKACRAGKLKSGDTVYMASVTDPYQPVERYARLTRAILEAMLEAGVQPRLTIQTRSPLVTRDIDLFQRLERLRVNVTVTTDSDLIRRRYEPTCPSIESRLKALAQLAAAGVKIGVSISPMLPIRDVEAFAARLAALRADEYVTQYVTPGRSWFAESSAPATVRKLNEDGWSRKEYAKARAALARALADQRPLLEGAEGYAPA
jgi:DNA repair photolyase